MKTTPFRHQSEIFELSRDRECFAVWWEQGTGKSKLVIDTAFYLFQEKRITGLLVVAPNGVHSNFLTQEIPVHGWEEVCGYVWDTGKSTRKREQPMVDAVMHPKVMLSVLVMSYDAIARTAAGYTAASTFLTRHRAMMVLDESTAIAEAKTQRAKAMKDLGALAKYKRVLSGTPVADGPFKIYNQMRWLDDNYWRKAGLQNYFAFKNSFGVFERKNRTDGRQYDQLKFYQNLDYLHKLIHPHSSRVLKEDVLDLPPKLYSTVEFEMTAEQKRIYEELRTNLRAQIDVVTEVTAQSALVAMTRLQQITSGYVGTSVPASPELGNGVLWRGPQYMLHGTIVGMDELYLKISGMVVQYGENLPSSEDLVEISVRRDDPILFLMVDDEQVTIDIFDSDEKNPRIQALQSILEPITHKVIIWGRFRKDIDAITRVLGESAVRYDGMTKSHDRTIALDRFRNDDSTQYLVVNPATLSMGVTLTQAKTVIYYSNTYHLEKRLQSEDRAHRIGQTVSVNIIDLVARGSIDTKIVSSLRKKFNIAAQVNGDRLREWI